MTIILSKLQSPRCIIVIFKGECLCLERARLFRTLFVCPPPFLSLRSYFSFSVTPPPLITSRQLDTERNRLYYSLQGHNVINLNVPRLYHYAYDVNIILACAHFPKRNKPTQYRILNLLSQHADRIPQIKKVVAEAYDQYDYVEPEQLAKMILNFQKLSPLKKNCNVCVSAKGMFCSTAEKIKLKTEEKKAEKVAEDESHHYGYTS